MTVSMQIMPGEVDCLVLGGGITGAGVARDAAMRGLRTVLVDSDDFASGTSHRTSKLIHGGLRYLEHCHFKLVAEGIIERDRLLNRLAPNLVSPLRFVIPFEGRRFPKWLLTVLGLQVYGFAELFRSGRWSRPLTGLGLGRQYPALLSHPLGVCFWDAQTNDARLVMSTLRTAYAAGAWIYNYTEIVDAKAVADGWEVVLRSAPDGREWHLRARTLINATGPWSPTTANRLGAEPLDLYWVKGSHLLLRRPKEFGDDAVVIRSVRDGRALWVIPWETRLIVGSTESQFHGDLRHVRPEADEVNDLFSSFAAYFGKLGFGRDAIVGAFAGIRPIVQQEGATENSMSRHHEIMVDASRKLVTITGGKLTTFRNMAEQSVDHVERLIGQRRLSGEARGRLRRDMLWPGLNRNQLGKLVVRLQAKYGSRLPAPGVVSHLARHYGEEAVVILDAIAAETTLGNPLFQGLPYGLAELGYLCETERVVRLLDLVKRRTPLYFLADLTSGSVLKQIAEYIAPILSWSASRATEECVLVIQETQADMEAVNQQRQSSTSNPLAECA